MHRGSNAFIFQGYSTPLMCLLKKDLKKVLQATLFKLLDISKFPTLNQFLGEQKRSNYIVELHSLVVKSWPSCHCGSITSSLFSSFFQEINEQFISYMLLLFLLERAQLPALLNLKIKKEKLGLQERTLQQPFLHHMQLLKEMTKHYPCA